MNAPFILQLKSANLCISFLNTLERPNMFSCRLISYPVILKCAARNEAKSPTLVSQTSDDHHSILIASQ